MPISFTLGGIQDGSAESAAHIIVRITTLRRPDAQQGRHRDNKETGRDREDNGIDLLDHVIIGDGKHFSMKEAGHI